MLRLPIWSLCSFLYSSVLSSLMVSIYLGLSFFIRSYFPVFFLLSFVCLLLAHVYYVGWLFASFAVAVPLLHLFLSFVFFDSYYRHFAFAKILIKRNSDDTGLDRTGPISRAPPSPRLNSRPPRHSRFRPMRAAHSSIPRALTTYVISQPFRLDCASYLSLRDLRMMSPGFFVLVSIWPSHVLSLCEALFHGFAEYYFSAYQLVIFFFFCSQFVPYGI